MKKFVCIMLVLFVFFTMSFSVFSWSVPGDLAYYDDAVIYFGQVKKVFYGDGKAVVEPVKLIKGDVPLNELMLADICHQPLIPGNTYIFASMNDGVNDYVFFPDGYDTKTLKLSDRTDNDNDIEEMMNSGRYEKADNERIDRINNSLKTGTAVKLSDAAGLEKEAVQLIKMNDRQLDFLQFYLLCDSIDAYPVDGKTDIESYLTVMKIQLENDNEIYITSDGKIQLRLSSERSIYVISAEDRDKLLSLLPEEKLPYIHMGTFFFSAGAVLIVSVLTGILIIIKKQTKHNSR